MPYPKVTINHEKYRQNLERMTGILKKHGLDMMVVTKVFRADPHLIEIINNLGVPYIADSRVENLRTIKTDARKVLLRLPSIHEAREVVKEADISLNSEMVTIRALNDAAASMGKSHKVILMVDIGDLREGIYYKGDVSEQAKQIEALSHVELHGIGTNITCYGGVLPTPATIEKLDGAVRSVETAIGRELAMVSGGNSSHLAFLENAHPQSFTNLRIGEALALGRETAYGAVLEGFHDDVFMLEADIIELKEKPSYPEGAIGMNAFGKRPSFEDLGTRRRAILAIGKQDVDQEELRPLDEGVTLIGSSSDHIIADVTDSFESYQVGDVLRFKLTYGSVLSLMTSPYVVKSHV